MYQLKLISNIDEYNITAQRTRLLERDLPYHLRYQKYLYRQHRHRHLADHQAKCLVKY